jgi:hypothetical protein
MSGNEPADQPGAMPARATPFELAFGDAGVADRLFPELEAGVERSRVNPSRLAELVLVSEMTGLVREMVPPDAPPGAIEQHRAMLFHAFNFWRHGSRLYLFDPAVARFVVESSPATAEWNFSAPQPSCYLQLPANLFWGSIAPDAPPEPVDGYFVTVEGGTSRDDTRLLEAMMVLGIRRHRAGFSTIPFRTEVGPGVHAEWADAPSREEGRDFDSVLPGGDLANLYSVLTVGEAMKLMYRLLWYLDTFPDQLLSERAEPRTAERPPGGPPPSRLSYRRAVLRRPDASGA